MLTDWYFCCAIEAEPDATHAILGIIDVIERSQDVAMREAAFDELERTETWTQVYLLPAVIRSMRARQDGSGRLPVEAQYFERLVQFSRVEAQSCVSACLWALGSDGRIHQIEPLNKAAEVLAETESAPERGAPYLDVAAFVAETVLAAVLASQFESDDVPSAVGQAIETRGVLYRFLERALEGRFGRMALCQAAQLAAHPVVGYDTVALSRRISAVGVLALEPDLLDLCARIMFRKGITETVMKQVARNVAPKVLLDAKKRISAADEETVRGRLGIPASAERPMDLSAVLWRATVLWRLGQIDPSSAVQPLIARWLTQDNEGGRWRLWIPVQSGTYLVQRAEVEPLAALLGHAALARHLLLALPASHPSRRQLLLIVAYCADVLANSGPTKTKSGTLARWLYAMVHHNERGEDALDRALGGFALGVRARIEELSTSRDARVDMAEYLTLFDAQGLRPFERDFVSRHLPRVLVTWMADAYLGTTSISGARRWEDLIPPVYERHHKQKNAFPSKVVAACLMRYLVRGNDPIVDSELDWRVAGEERGLQWSVNARQLLLAVAQPRIDDWVRGWDEPEPEKLSTWLTRATERVAALSSIESASRNDPRYSSWLEEWRNLVTAVSDPQPCERFLRLRLLELLDSEILRGASADQMNIATLILEFGHAYDLLFLFRRVFAEEGPVSQARREVRIGLARAAARWLDRQEHGLEVRRHEQHRAQPPRDAALEMSRAAVVRGFARRIALLGRSHFELRQAATALDEEWRRLRDARARMPERPLPATIDSDELSVQAAPWQRHAIVIDQNAQRATVFGSRLEARDVFDGLSATAEAWAALVTQPSTETRVLAVVVAVKATGAGTVDLLINWGADRYVWYHGRVSERLEVGNILAVTMKRTGESWAAVTATASRLRDAYAPGELGNARIQDSPGRPLEIDFPEPASQSSLSPAWDADLSRHNWNQRPGRAGLVPAVRDEQNGWMPLDGDLRDLISDTPADHPSVVLTLVGTVVAPATSGWRLASRPGCNYIVSRGDCEPEMVEALDNAVETTDGGWGVLVAVEPVATDDAVLLRLATTVSDAMRQRYERLELPLDYRNIAWRQLFHVGDTESAHSGHDGGWYIDLLDRRPPGFNARVKVTHPPGGKLGPLITVTGWDPARGVLEGEAVDANTVYPREKDNWADFVARWTAPIMGNRVVLTRALWRTWRASGAVMAITDENVRVWVDAESLTLLPIPQGSAVPIHRREAEIAHTLTERGTQRRAYQDFVIDDAAIPPDALREGKCVGIITTLYEDSERCEIAWDCADPQPRPATITNLRHNDFRLVSQGTVIEGHLEGQSWRFYPRVGLPTVRALWYILEDAEAFTYVGDAQAGSGRVRLGEVSPGQLIIDPTGLSPYERPLTKVKRAKKESLLGVNERLTAEVNGSRLKLQYRGGILAGRCRWGAPSGVVEVTGLRLHVEECGDGWLRMRREFDVRAVVERKQPPSARPPGPSPAELWRQFLAQESEPSLHMQFDTAAIVAPKDLEVRVMAAADGWTVRLPARHPGLSVPAPNGQWTSTVDVPVSEGPLVRYGRYLPEGNCRLFQQADGVWVASLRRVTPLTAGDLQLRLQEAPSGVRWKLDDALYYFGPADMVEPDMTVEHLFEFGYGRILRVPEHKLRLNGKRFNVAELLLWVGDRITAVTFTDADDSGDPILDINGFDIELSEAHELYDQRKQYSMLHMLRVVSDGGAVQIVSIEGFDRRALTYSTRAFDRVQARVLPSATLEQRFATNGAAREEVIYGRLDTGLFERSYGRDAAFEHVILSFSPGRGSHGLRDNELLILQAVAVVPLFNDTGLVVTPPDEVDRADIGSDLYVERKEKDGLLIRRRHFSVRDDLLLRILRDEHAAPMRDGTAPKPSIKGRLLLARVFRQGDRKYPRAALTMNPPHRTSRALELEATKRPVLVSVDSHGADGISVEFRPGLFVRLASDELVDQAAAYEKGAIVRVAAIAATPQEPARFRIERAAFGDSRYVPDGGRPVVMLPKNELFRVDNRAATSTRQYWQRNVITIADLPALLPIAGTLGNDGWRPPDPRLFVQLLQAQHPRVATIGFDNDRLRIDPRGVPQSGHLVPSEASFAASLTLADGTSLPSSWSSLTFADEPVAGVLDRAQGHEWAYHDDYTVVWDEELKPKQLKLDAVPRTCWNGPLFFHAGRDSRLTLRYPVDQWRRYGLPVDLLIDHLRRKRGRRDTLPVVGGTDESLWVEIVPGRIVEVPGALVEEATVGTPLDEFDWASVSPGDRVTLTLSRQGRGGEDSYGVDTIRLERLERGSRAAIVGDRTVLPILEWDASTGAVAAGYGRWNITLPFEHDASGKAMVLIGRDNLVACVSDDERRRLSARPGDVLLLAVNTTTQRPFVAGWPELSVWPTPESWRSDESWSAFTAGNPAADRVGRPPSFRFRLSARGLEPFGGALPVVVDSVGPNGRIVFVSPLDDGRSAIQPGRFASARVLGLLDHKTCVLHCGRLMLAPVSLVVSGVPPKLVPQVIESLRDKSWPVWLRRDAGGTLHRGIASEASSEGPARTIFEIGADPAQPDGVVVVSEASLALYWLPRDRTAWTAVPPSAFGALLVNRTLPRVRFVDTDHGTIASVVDGLQATQVLDSLRVGDSLTVRILRRVDDSPDVHRYVGESLTAKILLDVESRGSDVWAEGRLLPVEVTSCQRRPVPRVSTVPVGQRPLQIDLAPSLLAGADLTATMDAFAAARRQSPRATGLVKHWSDDQLIAGLWGAFDRKGEETGESPSAMAHEWLARHRSDAYLFAPAAILAVLVLDTGDSARDRREVTRMTRNIAQRALRSGHIEVVARWVSGALAFDAHPFWKRLAVLRKSAGHPTGDVIKRLRQASEAAHLLGDASTDLVAVAEALSASTGQLPSLSDMIALAPLTLTQLAPMRLLLSRGAIEDRQERLPDVVRTTLMRVLDQLVFQRIDLTLPRSYK